MSAMRFPLKANRHLLFLYRSPNILNTFTSRIMCSTCTLLPEPPHGRTFSAPPSILFLTALIRQFTRDMIVSYIILALFFQAAPPDFQHHQQLVSNAQFELLATIGMLSSLLFYHLNNKTHFIKGVPLYTRQPLKLVFRQIGRQIFYNIYSSSIIVPFGNTTDD